MSSDIKQRLRVDMHAYGICQEAAARIEALEGELEKWRSDHNTQSKLLTAADARAERLRVALEDVADRMNCRGEPDLDHYCPKCDNSLHYAKAAARKALEDDKQ